MQLEDLDRRLSALEQEVRASLDAVQHSQRMQVTAANRKFEAEMAQLRQDLTTVSSRVASQVEVEELRKELRSRGGVSTGGDPGWQDAAALVPRIMDELARVREELQFHRPGGDLETGLAELQEAVAALRSRQAERSWSREDLEAAAVRAVGDRVARLEERLQGEGTRMARLEERLAEEAALVARISEASQGRLAEGLEVGQKLLAEVRAEMRDSLEDVLQARDFTPEIEGLAERQAKAEAALAELRALASAGGRPELKARLDGLERSLQARLEALERSSGVGELQRKLEGLEAGALRVLETRLQGLERALGQRPSEAGTVDAGALEALRVRLETLESRPAPEAPGVSLQDPWVHEVLRRLEALESRPAGAGGDPAALEAVQKRLEELEAKPAAKGKAGDRALVEALHKRIEALEARAVAGGVDPLVVETLSRRVESLEQGGAGDTAMLALRIESLELGAAEAGDRVPEALRDVLEEQGLLARRLEGLEKSAADAGMLALRVESLELGVGVERERVREVFRDLLEEHGLLLRRLESRLTLLVQDFRRLADSVPSA